MHNNRGLIFQDKAPVCFKKTNRYLPAASATVLWGIDVTSIVFALAAAFRHNAAGDFLDSRQAYQYVNGAAKGCHLAEKGGNEVKIKGTDEAPV